MKTDVKGTYAEVNGLNVYYERHGSGEPLILLHGAFGLTDMFGEVLPRLAEDRQVIAVDLQAHGRTADIDRPLRLELMADDVAALIAQLGFEKADVMGYSMGGGVALRTAVQHPEVMRKLVVVSFPFKDNGWYPEILEAMRQINRATAARLQGTPMYKDYVKVAPHPERFPELCEKLGDLERQPYDWSEEVAAITAPTLLVFGDADGVPPAHAAAFFGLLGGGKRDAGLDGSGMSNARLAILPGMTHYDICVSPVLASTVIPFLEAPMPQTTKKIDI